MTLLMIQTHPNHIRINKGRSDYIQHISLLCPEASGAIKDALIEQGPMIHQMIKTHRIIQNVGITNWFSTCSSHSQDTYLLGKDFYSTVDLDRQTLYWTESLWIATTSLLHYPSGRVSRCSQRHRIYQSNNLLTIIYPGQKAYQGPTILYGSGPKRQFPTIK